MTIHKIGLGGGCHWCTEGVFQSLKGVIKVDQGWIKSTNENQSFSEAIIVHFKPMEISLETLIEIHLLTHSSSASHSMRNKYRSAIYYYSEEQKNEASRFVETYSIESKAIITKIIPFSEFRMNEEKYLNYYHKNPEAPFCTNYITPKLQQLLKTHKEYLK